MSFAKTCHVRGTLRVVKGSRSETPSSGVIGTGGGPGHAGYGLASSARVLTQRGLVPAGELQGGDTVSDGLGGWAPVAAALHVTTDLGADRVLIAQGALGGGLPRCDLELGLSVRLRMRSDLAARLVGGEAVLISAAHLVGLPGITRVSGFTRDITHVLFDRYGCCLAEDLVVEGFVPEVARLESLPEHHKERVHATLPKLRYTGALASYEAQLPEINAREARQILAEPVDFGAEAGKVAVPPKTMGRDPAPRLSHPGAGAR